MPSDVLMSEQQYLLEHYSLQDGECEFSSKEIYPPLSMWL